MSRSPHPASPPPTRPLVIALLLAVLATGGLIAPAQAAPDRASRATSVTRWATAPVSVASGSVYVARTRVTGGSRPVRLERRTGKGWRTIAAVHSGRYGYAKLRWTVPRKATTVAVRIRVPRAGAFRPAVSQIRWVKVKAPRRSQGSDAGLSPMLREVLTLVNEVRTSGHKCGGTYYPSVPAVDAQPLLANAAESYARMLGEKQFFSHTSPNGDGPGERIKQAGYDWHAYGENLAAGYTTPSSVVEGWLDSPGHCENMMNGTFRDLGLGYAHVDGSPYGHYWVQDFGTR